MNISMLFTIKIKKNILYNKKILTAWISKKDYNELVKVVHSYQEDTHFIFIIDDDNKKSIDENVLGFENCFITTLTNHLDDKFSLDFIYENKMTIKNPHYKSLIRKRKIIAID